MIEIRTYYHRQHRLWCAYVVDGEGNDIVESHWASTKELAIFYCGMDYKRSGNHEPIELAKSA